MPTIRGGALHLGWGLDFRVKGLGFRVSAFDGMDFPQPCEGMDLLQQFEDMDVPQQYKARLWVVMRCLVRRCRLRFRVNIVGFRDFDVRAHP